MGSGHARTMPVYRDRLGLANKPKTFEEIKEFMNEFNKGHMDCELSAIAQPKLCRRLEKELCTNYQITFSGREKYDRLKAAISLAMYLHGRHRRIVNKGRVEPPTKSREIIVIDDSSEDEVAAAVGQKKTPVPQFPKREPSLTPIVSLGGPTRDTQSTTPSQVVASHSVQDPVYMFLDACVPSMVQFHSAFWDYGCKNKEHLLAVSSWPLEKTLRFLHNVASSTDATMTEMDIEVLQHHLANYS